MRRHLALVPFLLLLTACGQQGGTTASTPSPEATTKAATTTEPAPTPSKTAQPPTAPPVSGTQYAFVKKIDPATRVFTYDLVEWFEGKAAVKACADDGEQPAENDWCTGYYIRNKNTKLRTATFAADAVLRVVDLGELKKAALTELEPDMLLRFEIDGSVITEADQIYLP